MDGRMVGGVIEVSGDDDKVFGEVEATDYLADPVGLLLTFAVVVILGSVTLAFEMVAEEPEGTVVRQGEFVFGAVSAEDRVLTLVQTGVGVIDVTADGRISRRLKMPTSMPRGSLPSTRRQWG